MALQQRDPRAQQRDVDDVDDDDADDDDDDDAVDAGANANDDG